MHNRDHFKVFRYSMNENKLTKQNLRALVVMAGLQIAKFETALNFQKF